jgi:hypothetical protein
MRESEREGRRKESQKHTTQFTFIVPEDGRKIISSLSLAPWQSQQSLVGKIWHAVCNRSDLFLSMPLREPASAEKSDGTNVPIFPIAAHFPHENKQQSRFRDVEWYWYCVLWFREKNDPKQRMHENKLALFIAGKRSLKRHISLARPERGSKCQLKLKASVITDNAKRPLPFKGHKRFCTATADTHKKWSRRAAIGPSDRDRERGESKAHPDRMETQRGLVD